MTKSCPSCGGKGYKLTKTHKVAYTCGECGGSGEVDVAKAEREAVAAGYKKVSLKEKPSEAEVRVKAYADGFKAGWDALERKIRNIDLEALMVEYGEDTGIPLNAYERAQIRSVFKRVLRGLLEEKK